MQWCVWGQVERMRHAILLWVVLAITVRAETPVRSVWTPAEETLLYRVYWGIFRVGNARTETEWVEHDGKRLLAIRMLVKSNAFVARLYPVDNYVESLVDPDTFLPVRYVQRLWEGRARRHEITEFDRVAGKARWRSLTKGREKEYDIEPDTRDIVSFMFYMRTRGTAALHSEKNLHFSVLVDDKVYDLTVTKTRYEKVRVRGFGTVRVLRLEPLARFGQVFVRRGRMWLWISDDERCLCTTMAAKVPLARVKAHLVGVRGGAPGDFWTMKQAELDRKKR